MALGSFHTLLLALGADLRQEFLGFGQRNNLLDVKKQRPVFKPVRFHPHTTDIDVPFTQPDHRRCQFFAEIGGGKDDVFVSSELLFVRLTPVQEPQNFSPRRIMVR